MLSAGHESSTMLEVGADGVGFSSPASVPSLTGGVLSFEGMGETGGAAASSETNEGGNAATGGGRRGMGGCAGPGAPPGLGGNTGLGGAEGRPGTPGRTVGDGGSMYEASSRVASRTYERTSVRTTTDLTGERCASWLLAPRNHQQTSKQASK